MVVRLVQTEVPLLQELLQPNLSVETVENPPPQHPHLINPLNRNLGLPRSHASVCVCSILRL